MFLCAFVFHLARVRVNERFARAPGSCSRGTPMVMSWPKVIKHDCAAACSPLYHEVWVHLFMGFSSSACTMASLTDKQELKARVGPQTSTHHLAVSGGPRRRISISCGPLGVFACSSRSRGTLGSKHRELFRSSHASLRSRLGPVHCSGVCCRAESHSPVSRMALPPWEVFEHGRCQRVDSSLHVFHALDSKLRKSSSPTIP